MSGKKCKHCGSSDIEVDPARGDAVCTNCGTVLEDNIIVAEVEFVENGHGGASTIGQFVSADTKGGATGFGGAFNAGIGQESREVTVRKARQGITALCQQLRLNQQCIDIACNFYKMALSRHLTQGRLSAHIQAACVYITCRTEGTAHLLIDISDALGICCYQLGRSYFKLSRALCINIPSIDPCLYILRFAAQLQLDEKQHEVSMTALRLVQRMKRDSIHSGRRPSGLCGAALLIAARLHDFNRTPADVVRIVKVHESTLRKRLLEFGETPSSALTLDEFMTVDLEEEQDPPAFRAARKRDKERLQKLLDEEDGEKELSELQREIDLQLEKDNMRRKVVPSTLLDESDADNVEASKFLAEDAINLLGEISKESSEIAVPKEKIEKGLGPELAVIGLAQPEEKYDNFVKPEPKTQFGKDLHRTEDLYLNDKDEEYIDTLIMSETEAAHKTRMWNHVNAMYLKEQKTKEEMRAREKEEGKDKKKRVRGSYKKKAALNAATAGEAIEKMLQEKKISSKINYDILRSLDQPGGSEGPVLPQEAVVEAPATPLDPVILSSPVPQKRKKKNPPPTLSLGVDSPAPATPSTPAPATPAPATPAGNDPAEDYDEEAETEVQEGPDEMSLAAMLRNGPDDDEYDYYEEEY